MAEADMRLAGVVHQLSSTIAAINLHSCDQSLTANQMQKFAYTPH